MSVDLVTAQQVLRGLRVAVTEQEDQFTIQLRDQSYLLKKDELEFYLSRKSELRQLSVKPNCFTQNFMNMWFVLKE